MHPKAAYLAGEIRKTFRGENARMPRPLRWIVDSSACLIEYTEINWNDVPDEHWDMLPDESIQDLLDLP